MFDHERLDVYRLSLDFLVFAGRVCKRFPRGNRYLNDQLLRASTSIVLNLAEGTGKHSRPDKRRFYITARGSATECAALLDIYARLNLVVPGDHKQGKHMLVRIVSMLIKLAQRTEEARPASLPGTADPDGAPSEASPSPSSS